MAGGWSRDGAVQDQIDDTISDAVHAARDRMPSGEGTDQCEDCGDHIPDRRREVLPGIGTCVRCQTERDKTVAYSTINRRGSKDSQLR